MAMTSSRMIVPALVNPATSGEDGGRYEHGKYEFCGIRENELKPQESHTHEFLLSAKNSLSRSSDTSRSSFRFSTFSMAPELVSTSSRDDNNGDDSSHLADFG